VAQPEPPHQRPSLRGWRDHQEAGPDRGPLPPLASPEVPAGYQDLLRQRGQAQPPFRGSPGDLPGDREGACRRDEILHRQDKHAGGDPPGPASRGGWRGDRFGQSEADKPIQEVVRLNLELPEAKGVHLVPDGGQPEDERAPGYEEALVQEIHHQGDHHQPSRRL